MKAVRFHQHGGPEVLRYEDAPDPQAKPGWIVVRVRACAMNHLDIWQRRGLERVKIPFPHISGADVAGEISALGEGVTGLRVGQRVMLQPGLSDGTCARCLAGEDNFCEKYDVLGYQSDGGDAELVTVPAVNAWHMLHSRARLAKSETVLVIAAGSGVGQAAVQLAKLAGARVIATAGGDAKLEHAKKIGADEVIDHYREDVSARARDLTNRRGVDVVIEHVGTATWERSVKALARGGRLVTCGATTGYDAKVDLRVLFARQLSLLGSYMGGKPELLRASELFFRGEVHPIVDRTFPLSETAQAHNYLESSSQFGKVVLVV
jgi:NADPH:quinone reductase-like Zn-dependent oxidoreductase